MNRATAFIAVLVLSGCANGNGARWYAPASWFSHAPADAVDATAKKEDAARNAVIKAAQKSSHETSFALAAAPASRPVAVATDLNASTVALLDQAAGPLDAETVARLRSLVAGLVSDNAALRESAQAQQAKEQRTISDVSAALAKAETKSDAAEAKLRAAFDKENALANELRSQRALLWIAGGVAFLLACGWVYVRYALGGIPSAIGQGLAVLRRDHPEAGKVATDVFNSFLNRHEQTAIRKTTL